METELAFAATGFLLLLISGIKIRKYFSYKDFQDQLKNSIKIEELDFSGDTEYSRCYAHHWLMENVIHRKHGKLGNLFQSILMYNTLSATLWLSMIGVFVMILYLIIIHAMVLIGFTIGVIFVGILLAVGPSTPHISNLLVKALMEIEIESLKEGDYVYVKLANDSILQWIRVLTFFGFCFIFISPWGDSIPLFLSSIITSFVMIFILNPAFFIMEFSVIFALIYIASILPLFMVCIGYSIQLIRRKTSTKKSSIFQ